MKNLPRLEDQPDTLDRNALATLLAPILYRAESTILRNISRNSKLLPEHDKKNGRSKIWFTQNVYHWINPKIYQRIEYKFANPAPLIASLAESLMSSCAGK